ncbi:MAG: glycosyltransferase [Sandaracinaceae bacterium]|nr:glycosyltransferase [Sandaracinaceae bacterium]
MQQPIVSVVVVVHDRADMVDALFRTLEEQSEPRFEVVVLLNDATRAMNEVVAAHAGGPLRLRTIECSAEDNASTARNRGTEHAAGEILYFVDDDTELHPESIAELVRITEERPDVDIFGGPNLTPPDDPVFAHITGAILASPMGTGPARSRYARVAARAARERHLILCNLAVRRRVFDSGISFPVLFGGEENRLMGHATATGFELWYAPELWVYHRRRRNLSGYVEQMVRYGRGRALAMWWAPRTMHVAYLVPVGFLGYLAALPLLSVVTPLAGLPLAAYAGLVSIASVDVVVRERRPLWLPVVPGLFLVTHLAYAWGLSSTLVRLRLGGSGA